jgi:hypothetical protein
VAPVPRLHIVTKLLNGCLPAFAIFRVINEFGSLGLGASVPSTKLDKWKNSTLFYWYLMMWNKVFEQVDVVTFYNSRDREVNASVI